jgi:peptide deformylase
MTIEEGKENKILRNTSKPVDVIDDGVKSFIEEMKEVLAKSKDGIGLAAPQVGKNLRIFVIDPELAKEDKTVFINPEIKKVSKNDDVLEEGCLSLPNEWNELGRPDKVTIKATDENGKKFKLRAKGLLARLVVHEVDHLNGILFIDHLS